MKQASLLLMVLLYPAAGINHFVHPGIYMNIMPPWIPLKSGMVLISGICEIVFALLLIFNTTRRFAAWAIICLLVAVFPANIQMMLNYRHNNAPNVWITIARLPLQVLLIVWAYSFTHKKTSR